jgi:succinoglycan biosynthesis protein ExoM
VAERFKAAADFSCYTEQSVSGVRILPLSARPQVGGCVISRTPHAVPPSASLIMAPAVRAVHITVCVCTFRRPGMLAALLRELGRQETAGEFSYSVVVADNDREQTGQAIVEAAAATSRVPIAYCVEPEQNIAKARNRAIREARGEFLAFIDDDELPPVDWLLNALRFCVASGADGVLGPVRPYFEHVPPPWIVKSRLFERPELQSGHRLGWRECRSGNVLLRRALINCNPAPFDESFGNGSEDKDFFRRFGNSGATFLWCADAPVHELVPRERCSRAYLVRRALLRGQNETRFTNIGGVAKSSVAILIYLFILPPALLVGQHQFMRYLIRACDHAGKLLALFRIRPMGDRYVS